MVAEIDGYLIAEEFNREIFEIAEVMQGIRARNKIPTLTGSGLPKWLPGLSVLIFRRGTPVRFLKAGE
jgi:hypothetical protein